MSAKDDKTEAPTAKRRRESRDQGQVARSHDLSGAGVLVAGLIAVALWASSIASRTGGAMTTIFGDVARPHNVITAAGLHGLSELTMNTVLKSVLPVAALCILAAFILNIGQTGLRLTPQALKPSFSKINPISGIKNLLSPNTTFQLLKDIVKVAVVGSLVAMTLIPDITHLGANVGTTPGGLAILVKSGVEGIAFRAAIAYVFIGIGDYVWQKRRFEKNLKMTKQEVKDEVKQRDLPPEVRRAIRRRQFQASRARMMAAVPAADVVITNPTHYAVALEYSGDNPAPIVVAKGKDHVAAQIRRIATEHNVPLVPDPPLARQLFASVEIDQMIPADLYAAVAQVLAFVYRAAARRKVSV